MFQFLDNNFQGINLEQFPKILNFLTVFMQILKEIFRKVSLFYDRITFLHKSQCSISIIISRLSLRRFFQSMGNVLNEFKMQYSNVLILSRILLLFDLCRIKNPQMCLMV